MFLIVYDIADNKLRTSFAKFLNRYGKRIQLSVFEIENSNRILKNIQHEIKSTFEIKFSQADSVLIFNVPDDSCIAKYGYPMDDDKDLVIR